MIKKNTKRTQAKKTIASPNRKLSTESAMRNVQKALEGKNFTTLEDINKALAKLTSPGSLNAFPDMELTEKEEAQELAFDAMEADTPAQARKLAKRALALDPECVDALVLLTGLDARSPRKAIEGLQKAVQAGERSLGPDFIRENKGHFWLILETRPWMRAMQQLADLLRGEELYDEAIRIYERMIELNPNDNQGVRDPLLGLYLAVGNLKAAARLLKQYEKDSMANFEWGRVLERFLADDLTAAAKALAKARACNPHVELYLTGRKPIPEFLPEMYSMGSEEEAILCMDNLALAWSKHADALFWLLEICMPEDMGTVTPIQPRKKTTALKNKLQ